MVKLKQEQNVDVFPERVAPAVTQVKTATPAPRTYFISKRNERQGFRCQLLLQTQALENTFMESSGGKAPNMF